MVRLSLVECCVVLKGRVDFDITRYDTHSKNQIIPLTLAGSTGYDNRVINAGDIESKGVEIMLKLTPVILENGFKWEISANFARNRSKVIELADGVPSLVQQAPGEDAAIVANVGERMGAIYGPGFERVADGPMAGQIVIGATGLPVKTTNPIYLGNANPDWTGGISNMFSFKDFHYEHCSTFGTVEFSSRDSITKVWATVFFTSRASKDQRELPVLNTTDCITTPVQRRWPTEHTSKISRAQMELQVRVFMARARVLTTNNTSITTRKHRYSVPRL
ncbi:MAG: hypothetical protein WDO15_29540 [Bacteroidota bacterium]